MSDSTYAGVSVPLPLGGAIAAFQGEMRRTFQPDSIERYSRQLELFAETVGITTPVTAIDTTACRGHVDKFENHAEATTALLLTILSSFFTFLVMEEHVDRNPIDKIRRPKVPPLHARKRKRMTSAQTAAMLAEAQTWPEVLCVFSLAFLGVRRRALGNLRWRDVDAKQWSAAFTEKGNKRITKPVPHQLRAIYKAYALERSSQGNPIHPDEPVVPNRAPMPDPTGPRSSRVIYEIVKTVAKRAKIDTHCHAFRAAFAVQYLLQNPSQLEPLRILMGHQSISTTQGYLSEAEGRIAMENVVSLTFSSDTSNPHETDAA